MPKTKTPAYKTIIIRTTPGLHAELTKRAKHEHRSLNAQIITMLEAQLAAEDDSPPPSRRSQGE